MYAQKESNVNDCLDELLVVISGLRDLRERLSVISNANQSLKEMMFEKEIGFKMIHLDRMINEIYWDFIEGKL